MIRAAHILPIVMIMLSLGAAGFYALDHDARRAIYWIAAAVITTVVTF